MDDREVIRLPPFHLARPAYVCAAVHLLALGLMALVLAPGTEVEPDVLRRARYVAEHATAWRAGWAVWMLSAGTLVGFYAWWAGRLKPSHPGWMALGCGILGALTDVTGETLYAVHLPVLAAEVVAGGADAAARYADVQATATWMTAVLANWLYTLGGIGLTLLTPSLRGRRSLVPWTTWVAGVALSVAGSAGSATGIAAASAVLFPALILTCIVVARELG